MSRNNPVQARYNSTALQQPADRKRPLKHCCWAVTGDGGWVQCSVPQPNRNPQPTSTRTLKLTAQTPRASATAAAVADHCCCGNDQTALLLLLLL